MALKLIAQQVVTNPRQRKNAVESVFEYQYDDGARRLVCTLVDKHKDGSTTAIRTFTHPQPVVSMEDAEDMAARIIAQVGGY